MLRDQASVSTSGWWVKHLKCTVGWGKSAHPFVSIRLFFRYKRVYLSAAATWAVWTSAAFLGRAGYFPSPCRKCHCLRTPQIPLLGPSPHWGWCWWNPWVLLWWAVYTSACGESSICVHLTWQDPAPALKNNNFNRPSLAMSTAKAQGEAQRLSRCSGKNVVCLVLSVVCVDISGTRRSRNCCHKGIVWLFLPFSSWSPVRSLRGSGAWVSPYHSSVWNGLSCSFSGQISEMKWLLVEIWFISSLCHL